MYFNHLDHFFRVVKIYSSSGYAVFGVFYVMEDSCHRVWFFFFFFLFLFGTDDTNSVHQSGFNTVSTDRWSEWH